MIFDLENVLNKKIITKNALNVEVHLKREDTIHPIISGNKYRKLIYNLKEAKQQNKNTVVTFGGAYSNHIAAVAAAGKVYGFKTIGVIRGEEIKDKLDRNATLKFAKSCGMTFKFISRLEFRNKNEFYFIENLKNEFGDFYNIPEGGTNALAIKGCEEILTQDDFKFNYVCTSVGTGGTVAGIINSTKPNQQVLGFSALKGDFLREDISKFAKQDNWKLITNYHFGGYAKINEELITFINTFKAINNIQLDPIYTGKMLFGIQDLIEKKYFPEGSKILAIHTGGLQGIQGMNERLKQKGLPIIK